MEDFSNNQDQLDSAHQQDPAHLHDSFLSDIPDALQNTSAPGLLMRAQEALAPSIHDEENEDDVTMVPEVLIRVRTATMTSADSSSLHTLTDRDIAESSDVVKEQRFSPNPAGAASASSSHVRHTTCGSVESEGFHSVTSDEGNLEELQQDWNQWSKEVS